MCKTNRLLDEENVDENLRGQVAAKTQQNGTLTDAKRCIDANVLEDGGDEDEQIRIDVDDQNQPESDWKLSPIPDVLYASKGADREYTEGNKRHAHGDHATSHGDVCRDVVVWSMDPGTP